MSPTGAFTAFAIRGGAAGRTGLALAMSWRYTGPPATLGSVARNRTRIIVWCWDCGHQVEPDPVAMAERYGAETTVPDFQARSAANAAAAMSTWC